LGTVEGLSDELQKAHQTSLKQDHFAFWFQGKPDVMNILSQAVASINPMDNPKSTA
jgi:hypothetical protein